MGKIITIKSDPSSDFSSYLNWLINDVFDYILHNIFLVSGGIYYVAWQLVGKSYNGDSEKSYDEVNFDSYDAFFTFLLNAKIKYYNVTEPPGLSIIRSFKELVIWYCNTDIKPSELVEGFNLGNERNEIFGFICTFFNLRFFNSYSSSSITLRI